MNTTNTLRAFINELHHKIVEVVYVLPEAVNVMLTSAEVLILAAILTGSLDIDNLVREENVDLAV